MRQLTTTSYALLGLLTLRPWSAYEFTRQMARSLHYIWPRAESAVYEEPKLLVAHGFATARRERRGRQTRTVYTITDAGRQAFRAWLGRSSAPPQFSSEAHVRLMFADEATPEETLATLAGLRAEAAALQERLLSQARGYLDGGPFPARLHVIVLTGRFLHEYASALERWAAWAEQEVRTWPLAEPEAVAAGQRMVRETLARFGDDQTASEQGDLRPEPRKAEQTAEPAE